MTPEERRTQLAVKPGTLSDTVISVGPHSQRDTDADAPEGASLAELERQLNEKIAELEALNARMNTFSCRFRATSRGLLWLAWLATADVLVSSFTLVPFFGPGYQAVFLPLTLACIVQAVWVSIPPKIQPLRRLLPRAMFSFMSTPLRVTLRVGSTAIGTDIPGWSLLSP